jgi:hypothetical protein
MPCPGEIAGDVSAFRPVIVGANELALARQETEKRYDLLISGLPTGRISLP